MKCSVCGFEETENQKMIGIFSQGQSFCNTNGNLVGLYGCPKCKTVIWTDDMKYINERKNEYKTKMKGNKTHG